MTITIIILNPQTGNGIGVLMMSCPEEMALGIWGFWKRVSWELRLDDGGRQLSFCHLGRELSFLPLRRQLSFLGLDRRRWMEILNITRSTACVSPRVAMGRSQEINKPFVLGATESACICLCISICKCGCITVVIHMVIVYNRRHNGKLQYRHSESEIQRRAGFVDNIA